MKKLFPEYIQLTDDEIKDIWSKGIITFDSNALLSLYRYSDKTSTELLKVLDQYKNQVWLSHQAALEFHSHRFEAILDQDASYETFVKTLKEKSKDFTSAIEQLPIRHPSIDLKIISKKINECIENVIKDVDVNKSKLDSLKQNDTILKKIDELFESKIGDKFDSAALTRIYKEGDKRYAEEIPPGYKDIVKDKDDKTGKKKYGDYIIWMQIIEKAKLTKKPIILITEEQKEDWWKKYHGKITGPRPELIREMIDAANVNFHMYDIERFIDYAQAEGVNVNNDAVQEVKSKKNSDLELAVFGEDFPGLIQDSLGELILPTDIALSEDSSVDDEVGSTK